MQLDYLGELRRTHTCGALRGSDAGKTVTLMGWVNRRRNLGNLIFIDLRDRTGLTQVVVRSDQKELFEKAGELGNEYVVAATGEVRIRESVNDKIPTGQVEVIASDLRLLNVAKTPPFSPADAVLPNEDTRLKYRYLDLRRNEMQANLELRHKVALAIRNHLSQQGFFEIETPFLTRSTPEGARDFLVPSRVHHGSFYALPQSPQLFKQILMISGCDKYFQIVRCFRDEDLRADRQLEFTQIDLEMSYPQQERVFEVVEGFVAAAWQAAGVTLPTPFPRMTYDEAMRLYGSDKPDLRLPAMTDVKDAFAAADLEKLGIAPELPVVALRIPKVGELSRKERDEIKPLFAAGKPGNAKLFDDWKRLEKNFPEAAAKIREKLRTGGSPVPTHSERVAAGDSPAGADDLVVIVAGDAQAAAKEGKQADHAVYGAAGLLRVALGQKYAAKHGAFSGGLKDASSYRWTWVTDFPMFEWDEEEKRWNAAHHPFTSPHERDMEKVLEPAAAGDLATVRANAYDIVLNGMELGSGSIRIHRQDVQRQIFRALGMSEEEAKQRFGFFLEALEYGTPPHGGIALGLDRIVMLLAGGESLREVIPFPKTAKAVDLMVDAPTPVEQPQEDQLELMAAFPGLGYHEWELATLADDLLRTAESTLSGPVPRDTKLQLVMALLYAKAYNDARSAIRLAKSGYGFQANVIGVQIYEAAVNALVIRGSEERASALLKTISADVRILAVALRDAPLPPEQREMVEQALAADATSDWPPIQKRLDQIPSELQQKYVAMLPLYEKYSHWELGSLAGRFSDLDSPDWNVHIGRSKQDVGFALLMVSGFFLDLSVAVCEAVGRPTQELLKWQTRAMKATLHP